ncbi:MAG: class II aldolase/adducin family protein, partial [Candidatus Acidiferrales bacterium]
GRSIPCFGTTHADTFHGPVPVTEDLQSHEIATEYEKNTGAVILRAFEHLNPDSIPGVLVRSHGPFAWGPDPATAAHNAVILEAVARMAYYTTALNHEVAPISPCLHDKHFLRKHGSAKYYGQPTKK